MNIFILGGLLGVDFVGQISSCELASETLRKRSQSISGVSVSNMEGSLLTAKTFLQSLY